MRFVVVSLLAFGLFGCPAEEEDPYNPPTACTVGDTRCENTVIHTCSAMRVWEAGTDCADSGATCVNGACSGGGCTDNHLRCGSSNNLEVCSDNVWYEWATCLAGMTCVDPGGGNAVCEGGVCDNCTDTNGCFLCDGAIVRMCGDGQWWGENWANCGDVVGDSSVIGWCYDFGGTWGADCIMPIGTDCVFVDASDDLILFGCGVSSGTDPTLGCHRSEGCVSAAACVTPFVPYCVADDLVYACHSAYEQELLVDCTWFDPGRTCGLNGSDYTCLPASSTTGDACNDVQGCAATHTCVDPDGDGPQPAACQPV